MLILIPLLNSLIICGRFSVGTLCEWIDYEEYNHCFHMTVLPPFLHFYASDFSLLSVLSRNQYNSHDGWQPHLIPDLHGNALSVHLACTCFEAGMYVYVHVQFLCLINHQEYMIESKIYTNISVNFFSWIFVTFISFKWIDVLHQSLVLLLCVFQWSDRPCVPHLLQRDTYYVYTQQELKEKLYQEIISYFDKGKVSVGWLVFVWRQRRKWPQYLYTAVLIFTSQS